MAVNFNLLAREGPTNLYEGFEQGRQAAAQNMLAQQKMAQEQEMNALRRQQAQVEMEGARLGQTRTRNLIAGEEEDRVRKRRAERVGMFRDRLLRAATPEAAREIVKMQYADPDLAPVLSQAGTLEQALAEVPDDPTQFQTYRQQEAMGMSEWMKSQLPKTVGNAIYLPSEGRFVTPPAAPKEPTTPSPVLEYQFARTPEGGGFAGSYQEFLAGKQQQAQDPLIRQYEYAQKQGFKGSLFDYKRSIAEAGRPPAAPREAASQKAPAGYRFTPSGDLEPIPGGPASPGLAPKDIQKREAAYPQATQAVNGFETKSEQFIKELERLRDDPGLNQITGPIYGRTPSVSREGSRAQALYDKIFAKGGFQALQDMREASKTGGALGNVSNEEGRRLEKSIVGGLDRTQNIADVQRGINDLIDEIRTSKSRVREAYDTTYEYRAQRGGGTAAKQMSPQDKQALDWANSNPKDPRAAQIKARLGVQ